DQRNYGFSLDVRKGILPYLYATLGIVWKISTLSILPPVPVRNLWPRRALPPKVSLLPAWCLIAAIIRFLLGVASVLLILGGWPVPAGPSRFMASMLRHPSIGICRGIPFYWSTPKLP